MANGIYKFQNIINNKIYIGQAANLEKRKQKHYKNAKYDMSHQEEFYKAIRKYGWENFSYEILESFDDLDYNQNRLDKLENKYILQFNSIFPNGYNMVMGGAHGAGISKRKKVRQYSLQGDFLFEYDSIEQASRVSGANRVVISRCCRGENLHAGGYQWRFTKDNEKIEKLKDITKLVSLKKEKNLIKKYIYQYDKLNNFINKFDTLQQASTYTKISLSNISECCTGKRKSAGGFVWRYIYE